MNKMLAVILISLTTLLSGCSYQGWVRYPCQEYKNWQNAECKPPQCEAIGQCTKDLLPEVDTQNG